MAAFYNPYNKMLKQLDSQRKSSFLKKDLSNSLDKSTLHPLQSTRLQIQTSDQIQSSKLLQHATNSQTHQNRTQALQQALSAQQAANAQYSIREQQAFESHLKESSLMREEAERVWKICSADAVERSRYVMGAVEREQLEKEEVRLHQTQVRMFTEGRIREEVEVSRVLAERAMREQILLREGVRGGYLY